MFKKIYTIPILIAAIIIISVAISSAFSVSIRNFVIDTQKRMVEGHIKNRFTHHLNRSYLENWQSAIAQKKMKDFADDILDMAKEDIIIVRLYNQSGKVIFSSLGENERLGVKMEEEHVSLALQGKIITEIKKVKGRFYKNVWEVYIPNYLEEGKNPATITEIYFNFDSAIGFIRRVQIIIWLTVTLAVAVITLIFLVLFGRKNKLLQESQRNIEKAYFEVDALKNKLEKYNKELEKKVAKRTAELTASEEKYRTLVESIPACVKLFDTKLHLIAINRYGREEHFLEEKSKKEIKKWDYLGSIVKEDRGRVKKAIRAALKGKITALELKHLPGGSRNKYCSSIFAPVKDEHGKILYVLFLSMDISERKESELRIKELNKLRSKFIQIVSHQLRTPLNSISWNLEALLDREFGVLKKDQEQFVRATLKSSRNIINTINNVVTAMDIEEGRIHLEKTGVSLESLAASVFGAAKEQCSKRQQECVYRPAKNKLPTVNIDSEKIRIVLNVLINNAVVYTKEKGRIVFKLRRDKNNIIFSVSDTGIGIPKAEQKNIFNRFYRASNAAEMQPDASGLGLYIAKNFVEAHGGKIWFESQEGKGTTFYVSLPVE